MLKSLTSSFFILIAYTLTLAQAVSIPVNAEKSTVNWLGKKLLGQHGGTVKLAKGSVVMNNGILGGGEFTIDMTSIACTDISDADMNARLIRHLKSEDFFAVEKFPEAGLKITKVMRLTDPDKAGQYTVTADLTIKGITNTIEFPVEVAAKGKGYTASAKITIDRSKWDVRYGSSSFFDNLGDKAIKNDIEFAVLLHFG
jgi:polyisoprenoid-binding protein YceI